MPDGQTRRVSRWLSIGLPVLLGVLVSVVFGVTTATADLSLGPHEARYAVTSDSTVTIDVGPLGTLQIDSPLPLTLGVRVTVQEIPAGVTAVDAATTLQALGGDLQSYLQFFSGPQATVQDVTRALVTDAAWRASGAAAILAGLWFGGRFMLGGPRRDELARVLAPHARTLVAGGLVVVVALTVVTSSEGSRDRAESSQVASAVFDGTALEGARVTGRLAGVLDTYGGYVLDAYRTNTAFYAAADAELLAAWTARDEIPDAAVTTPMPDRSTAADQGSGADPTGSGEGPSDAPVPDPTVSADADEADADETDADEAGEADDLPEPVVLLVVSDLHCNVGMAPLIRTAAEQSGASIILDAGDTTINGTVVEQYCVTTFRAAAPSGVEVVTSTGNHDSAEIGTMYRDAGATVLDGEVVTVEGIRILGDSDPNSTRIGVGTSSAGQESTAEAAARLADVACDDEDGVDLLLIHTPRVGLDALERGCVPVQVSGHMHRRDGPLAVGAGVRYVNASTAGAASGQPTVGPLRGVAEMTVLRFDPLTRRFMDYQLVEVRPDGSASVGPRLSWPIALATPRMTGTTADLPAGMTTRSAEPEPVGSPDPTPEP